MEDAFFSHFYIFNPLASMMRAFRALGVQVALEMKGIGKVAL
jgi:hypothetical protein